MELELKSVSEYGGGEKCGSGFWCEAFGRMGSGNGLVVPTSRDTASGY